MMMNIAQHTPRMNAVAPQFSPSARLTQQAKTTAAVQFGETVYFSDAYPLTVKHELSDKGKKVADQAIASFEKVGLALAGSLNAIAEAMRPVNPPTKDL